MDLAALARQAPPPLGVQMTLGVVIRATDGAGNLITGGFNEPIRLEFTVPPDLAPAGTTAGDWLLAFWDGSVWVIIDGEADFNADGSVTVRTQVSHFTIFNILLRARANVFPAPPPGRWVIGIAGTSDPEALVAAQPFEVAGIWTGPNLRHIYIPGAPDFVTTLNSGNLKPTQAVILRRR